MLTTLVPICGLAFASALGLRHLAITRRTVRVSGGRAPRAAVVLYSYYLRDPRPRREAEALVNAGWEVEVFCLRRTPNLPWHERIRGVDVFRFPMKRRRVGKFTYALQYGSFLLAAFVFLASRSLSRRYKIVHVHNMPDFLVFSAAVPRLLGAKVILDLHDPMPELSRVIYGLEENSRTVELLKKVERQSIGFADLVLTPNLAFKELFASRSCGPEKVQIVMNAPDEQIFHDRNRRRQPKGPGFNLMYHGSLLERNGLILAVQALVALRPEFPQLKLNIFGEATPYLDEVLSLAGELGLVGAVEYGGFKRIEEMPQTILRADLGLIPNLPNVFNEINLPTRIFEYLSLGKPVIVPRTKGIQDYFQENELVFFDSGSPTGLASAIAWAIRNGPELGAVAQRGQAVYRRHTWETQVGQYLAYVERLVEPDLSREAQAA